MLRLVATWHNIPEDTILHSHRCENLKSYEVDISVPSPECMSKSGHASSKQKIWTFVTLQVFGNDRNKSKFDSGGNLEEIEFR
jgi:hypothetical protein